MSFPIHFQNGLPNYAFSGETIVLPKRVGSYGVLELEAAIDRNLYVDSFTVLYGPDCFVSRLLPSLGAVTKIEDDLTELPNAPPEIGSIDGVVLTTGTVRIGTTTLAPPPFPFVAPTRSPRIPISDQLEHVFERETFRVPLVIPAGTTGFIQTMVTNADSRVATRWFEQTRI